MARVEPSVLRAASVQQGFSFFNVHGSLCAVLLVGSAVGCAWAAPAGSRANEISLQMPRLFYTPVQRTAVVRARLLGGGTAPSAEATDANVEPPPPPLTTFVLQGVTQGGQGSSAWINGQPLQNGEVLGGRTVHIGPQVVYLRQKGAPDVVLRPGQGSFDVREPVVDVVPVGAFSKNRQNDGLDKTAKPQQD